MVSDYRRRGDTHRLCSEHSPEVGVIVIRFVWRSTETRVILPSSAVTLILRWWGECECNMNFKGVQESLLDPDMVIGFHFSQPGDWVFAKKLDGWDHASHWKKRLNHIKEMSSIFVYFVFVCLVNFSKGNDEIHPKLLFKVYSMTN